jgi:hypothetical protein
MGVRPYCCEWSPDRLLLVLDLDAPSVALVTIGLELVGDRPKGDRSVSWLSVISAL